MSSPTIQGLGDESKMCALFSSEFLDLEDERCIDSGIKDDHPVTGAHQDAISSCDQRLTISSSACITASVVKRYHFASMSHSIFQESYRNKKPVVIHDLAMPWLDEIDWFDPVTYCHTQIDDVSPLILAAYDNRTFLKHEKCYQIYDMSTSVMFQKIGSWPASTAETLIKDAYQRIYARFYLDALPHLAEKIDLQKIMGLMIDENDQSFGSPNRRQQTFKTKNVGVWISCPGCETPLHFDLCHGFLIQVRGIKRFLLCRPVDSNCVYWNRSKDSLNACTSEVDLSRWLSDDFDNSNDTRSYRGKYPLIGDVGWYTATLKPGDTLYTPPGWWHHVLTDHHAGPSVSVLVPYDPDLEIDINLPNIVMDV